MCWKSGLSFDNFHSVYRRQQKPRAVRPSSIVQIQGDRDLIVNDTDFHVTNLSLEQVESYRVLWECLLGGGDLTAVTRIIFIVQQLIFMECY